MTGNNKCCALCVNLKCLSFRLLWISLCNNVGSKFCIVSCFCQGEETVGHFSRFLFWWVEFFHFVCKRGKRGAFPVESLKHSFGAGSNQFFNLQRQQSHVLPQINFETRICTQFAICVAVNKCIYAKMPFVMLRQRTFPEYFFEV